MQSRFISEQSPECRIETLPSDIFNLISSFLVSLSFMTLIIYKDAKSISRVIRTTNRMYQYDSNVFWHTIFMMRPPHKNPGFKIDKVDWRKLLLKKD